MRSRPKPLQSKPYKYIQCVNSLCRDGRGKSICIVTIMQTVDSDDKRFDLDALLQKHYAQIARDRQIVLGTTVTFMDSDGVTTIEQVTDRY